MANISGTNLVAPVVPFTTDDKYPTHYAKYGHGGWRTVNTLNDLNNIPSQLREEGMAVYCIEDKKTYIYVNSSWKELSFGGDSYTPCTKITYDELVSLRDNNNLIPGHQYRIIDYQTIVNVSLDTDIKSAKHQFDIIVTAIDSKTLNENAKATLHEFDLELDTAFDFPQTFMDVFGVQGGGGCSFQFEDVIEYKNKTYYTYSCAACPGYLVLMDWKDVRLVNDDKINIPVAYILHDDQYLLPSEFDDQFGDEFAPMGYISDYSGSEEWDAHFRSYYKLKTEAYYFTNSNLHSWDIKYCLDNDMFRFPWALTKFDAYVEEPEDGALIPVTLINTQSDLYPKLEYEYLFEMREGDTHIEMHIYTEALFGDNLQCKIRQIVNGNFMGEMETTFNFIQPENNESGKGVIFYMKDENGNEAHYDFKNILFKRYLITNNTDGLWLQEPYTQNSPFREVIKYDMEQYIWCYTITKKTDNEITDGSLSNAKNIVIGNYGFPNNGVFFVSSLINNAKIGYDCHNFTIQQNCDNITIGNSCHNFMCGQECYQFKCGDSNINWIAINCDNWTTGNDCQYWIAKDSSYWKTGHVCNDWESNSSNYWTCGNECHRWISTGSNYWQCGDYCHNWECKTNCNNWKCGNNCYGWTTEVSCFGWSCGNDCSDWTCASGCQYWTAGNRCTNWNVQQSSLTCFNIFNGTSNFNIKGYLNYYSIQIARNDQGEIIIWDAGTAIQDKKLNS